jgi:MFS family permease
MDTFGAVLGPAIALVFLYIYPGHYTWLFYLAFFPGIVAILATTLIRPKPPGPSLEKNISIMEAFHFWKRSAVEYKYLVKGLLLFALFNSSDLLLLLKIKETGYSDTAVIGIYIFYNLVYSLLAWPIGRLADRIGLEKIFIAGLVFFMITYTGFAFNQSLPGFVFLFIAYGIYAACTEGISKAWITRIVKKEETATAIGTYTGFQSIAALFASSFAGWLWYTFGAQTAFLSSGIVCLLVIIYFIMKKK